MAKGYFFSFEGIDTCGKTTQIKKLEKYLMQINTPAEFTKEPGSTAVGGALRRLLKYPKELYEVLNKAYAFDLDFTKLPVDQKRTPEAEMLMFLAARAEFMKHIIIPNLNAGISVIADRFADSTRAYQGGGRYNSSPEKINLINTLNKFVVGDYWPHKTFLLDISYEEMLKRKKDKADYIESLGKQFFKCTIDEYRKIAKEEPERVVLINGTKTIDAIFNEDVLPVVKKIYRI